MTPDGQGAHSGAHVHVGTVKGHAPADAITIPDAHLLFTGDFKRAGVDLVVSGDGHEIVLHDYFKGEKRAALASPDGAHLTGDIITALTGHTQFAQADGSPSVAQVIGHVTKLTGTATAIRNGVSIILNQGDNVNKGDVVASGSDSTLGITFIDGTVFGLASNAKMVLNEMIYDPNGSDNKSLISLVQGTISFVAGATAKHGDMKVDTPVATMGIRGTAVLVEIDFTVPATGGAPPAKFQVLVEPDGTTGSYILFDKVTLTPIATVNQAGAAWTVNGQGGVNFLSSAQLSADAQKIITDVFALKFSDLNNPNTKQATNFTDTITPQTVVVKTVNGTDVAVTVQTVNVSDKAADPNKSTSASSSGHIPGPPSVTTHNGAMTERALTTGSAALDTVIGTVDYGDINIGDVPTVKTAFTSFAYQNAGLADVTAALTATQLAAIKAVEAPLITVQDIAGLNVGTATWAYVVADGAFDFLAVGEVLTLTYTARVDNNFAANNEYKEVTFTITITGTNDTPVITSVTQAAAITELLATHDSATPDTATGAVTFTDADLTDSHAVTITGVTISGVTTGLAPSATVLGWLSLGALNDSTDGHTGSRSWTFSAQDKSFDYLAVGETVTFTYTIQVDDLHGGVVTQQVAVTITGTDDTPVITSGTQSATRQEILATHDSNTPDTATGTVTFTDLDLSDTRVYYGHATGGVVVTLDPGTSGSGTSVGNDSVGTDTFISGVTRVRGSEFNDIITGNAASNILEGQGGNDVIDGKGGNDTLTGGTGADIFVFESGSGADTITDFNVGQGDRIDLRAFTAIHGYSDLGISFNGGGDMVVSFAGNSITLTGVHSGDVGNSNFIFATASGGPSVAITVQSTDGYDFGALYNDLADSDLGQHDSQHIFLVDTVKGITFEMVGSGLVYSSGHFTDGIITEIDILNTTDPSQTTQDHVLVNSNGWSIDPSGSNGLFIAISAYQNDPSDTAALDTIFNRQTYSIVGTAGFADNHSKPHDGADTFFGGDHADVFNGMAGPFSPLDPGNDTVDYSHATSGVSVNLQTGATSGTAAAGDTFISIENLRGTRLRRHPDRQRQ